jgi:hypothetical protein
MSERARFGLIPTLAIHECRNTDEIAILAVIGCFMGDDGWNEAAPAEVAALCHLEADHTVRCIADLEARGLLRVQRREPEWRFYAIVKNPTWEEALAMGERP